MWALIYRHLIVLINLVAVTLEAVLRPFPFSTSKMDLSRLIFPV